MCGDTSISNSWGAISSKRGCFILSNIIQQKKPLWPPNSLGSNECSPGSIPENVALGKACLRLGAWDPVSWKGLCPSLQISKQAGFIKTIKINLQEVQKRFQKAGCDEPNK